MGNTANGMHFEVRGDGPETVVMLPGLGCSVRAWSAVTPLLPAYRLVLMDLPGHAGSLATPADGSSLATMAAPVLEACDELGIDRFAVVGLSFGGALGLRMALSRPDRVSAVMAFMPWNAGGADPGNSFMEQMYHSYGDEGAARKVVDLISLDRARTEDVAQTMPHVSEQFWKSWYGAGVYTSMSEDLPGLRVPACYVIGGKDVVAPRDKLMADVQAMPGGRLVYLAEAGHLAPYEHPELVALEIREFLGREGLGAAAAGPHEVAHVR